MAAAALTLDYACKPGSTHSFKEVTVAKLDAAEILGHVLAALCQNDKVHASVNTCRLKLDGANMKYDDRVVVGTDHVANTITHGLNNGCKCQDNGERIGHLVVQYIVVVSTMFCIGADILNATPQTDKHEGCRGDLVTLFTSQAAFATNAPGMLDFINKYVTNPTCIDIQINDTSLTVRLLNPDGPPITQDLNALCISPIMTVLILLNFVMSDAVNRLKNQSGFSPKDQLKWNAFVKDALCDKGTTEPPPAGAPPAVPPAVPPAGAPPAGAPPPPAGAPPAGAPPAGASAQPEASPDPHAVAPLSPALSLGDPGIGGSPISDFIRQTDATSFVDGMLSPRTSPSP